MLTIKHINDDRNETIISATEVSYLRGAEPSTPADMGVLYASSPHHSEPLRFTDGTVYVVNENGKTVGTYFFITSKDGMK